jgi:hypothetical protein
LGASLVSVWGARFTQPCAFVEAVLTHPVAAVAALGKMDRCLVDCPFIGGISLFAAQPAIDVLHRAAYRSKVAEHAKDL